MKSFYLIQGVDENGFSGESVAFSRNEASLHAANQRATGYKTKVFLVKERADVYAYQAGWNKVRTIVDNDEALGELLASIKANQCRCKVKKTEVKIHTNL
jgi:hypothetical protein